MQKLLVITEGWKVSAAIREQIVKSVGIRGGIHFCKAKLKILSKKINRF